jgi:Na+/phosphate symporter
LLAFLGTFAERVVEISASPGLAIAWAQSIFNVMMTIAILVLLRRFTEQLARNKDQAPC